MAVMELELPVEDWKIIMGAIEELQKDLESEPLVGLVREMTGIDSVQKCEGLIQFISENLAEIWP